MEPTTELTLSPELAFLLWKTSMFAGYNWILWSIYKAIG